jgi:hypothetical protein
VVRGRAFQLYPAPTGQAARQPHKFPLDVGATLPANPEPPELMQPPQRPLRSPSTRREQPIGLHAPHPIVDRADGIDPEHEALLAGWPWPLPITYWPRPQGRAH